MLPSCYECLFPPVIPPKTSPSHMDDFSDDVSRDVLQRLGPYRFYHFTAAARKISLSELPLKWRSRRLEGVASVSSRVCILSRGRQFTCPLPGRGFCYSRLELTQARVISCRSSNGYTETQGRAEFLRSREVCKLRKLFSETSDGGSPSQYYRLEVNNLSHPSSIAHYGTPFPHCSLWNNPG